MTISDQSATRDRRLIAAGVAGLLTRTLALFASLGSIAIMARSLSQVAFGVVATLTALLSYVNFMDFGLGNAVMTRVAWLTGRQQQPELISLVRTSLRILITIGATFSAASLLVIALTPIHRLLGATSIPTTELQLSLLALTTSVSLGIPASLGSRIQLGRQEGREDSVWFMTGSLCSLFLVMGASLFQAPMWGYVLATAGTRSLVSAIQTKNVLSRMAIPKEIALIDVCYETRRDVFRLARLFFVLQAAVVLGYQSDVLIVSSILSASSAGIFVVALRMFSPITTIVSGAMLQIWPAISEAFALGDLQWIRSRLLRSIAISITAALVASLILVLFGQSIAEWWVGPSLVPHRSLLVLFAMWTVYSVGMGQVGYLLNAAEIIRPQVILSGLMVIANVGLSIVLTKTMGSEGPVVGSLLAHLFIVAGPAIIFSVRILNGRHHTTPKVSRSEHE